MQNIMFNLFYAQINSHNYNQFYSKDQHLKNSCVNYYFHISHCMNVMMCTPRWCPSTTDIVSPAERGWSGWTGGHC